LYAGCSNGNLYAFSNSARYCSVVFNQTGLPSNAQWNVTLDGQTKTAEQGNITFNIASGNYTYKIALPFGYVSLSASSKRISINGNMAIVLSCEPSSKIIAEAAAVVAGFAAAIVAIVAVYELRYRMKRAENSKDASSAMAN
jgi:hypothetical protein